MKNKGNTLGIVIVVLAVIAVLWFFTSGKALVVSKPAPNTITASAINAYDPYNPVNPSLYAASTTSRTVYPSYPSYPSYASGKVAYVSYPISSSSSTSNYNYSSSYPSYPTNTYTPPATYYPTTPNYGGCYVGGCSSQLCSDQPNAVSTCEYRPEYSCYQRGRCERQMNGACGWTPTAELQACLNSAY